MSVDESKFQKVPLAEITSPEKPGPLWTYKDYWWAVTPDDCVLIFKRSNSPQCNTNRAIVERVMLRHGEDMRAVRLQWAYLQFDISEYV